MMIVTEQARLLMDAVAVLHSRGYGLLKLYSYVKDGLGAWRCWVFASQSEFPNSIQGWQGPKWHCSLPGSFNLDGSSPTEVADCLLSRCPDLAVAGLGQDKFYTDWYQAQLAAHPDSILIMESSMVAKMLGHGEVPVPPLISCPAAGTPEKHGTSSIATVGSAGQYVIARAMARARRRSSKP